eukprot:6455253-Amphidinium_carterae.1
MDILFFCDKRILHMIDDHVKWSAGCILEDLSDRSLLAGFTRHWTALYGPPRIVVMDGERGMESDEVLAYFDKFQITRVVRAPEQHAHLVERHNELLWQLLHKTSDQAADEGYPLSDELLLCECLIAKNSFLSIGGETPYRALYGRTPRFLP